jgi:hypothetical protein
MMTATALEMAHVTDLIEADPAAASAPPLTQFGAMLRLWRETQGLSLRDVERFCGIDHCTLQRLEKGGQCDVRSWLKLQRWLFGPAYQGAR